MHGCGSVQSAFCEHPPDELLLLLAPPVPELLLDAVFSPPAPEPALLDALLMPLVLDGTPPAPPPLLVSPPPPVPLLLPVALLAS